jgi:hypothetical protein
MAITITDTPDAISAAYRPVIWTATSNTGSKVRMIADVKIDGTIRANIDKDPRLGTADTFDFDVQSVLQDYLTYNLQSISGNINIVAGSSEVSVLVDLYDVISSGGLLSTAWEEDGSGTPDKTSSAIHAVNATLQHLETQDMDIYTVDDTTKKFLTNAPLIQRIGENETIQLHYVTNLSNTRFRLIQYNSAGASISDVLSSSIVVTDKAGILLLDEASMLSNAVKFEVILHRNPGDPRSETRTFNIDTQCYDNAVRLKWLNPLGGFDSYTFVSKKEQSLRHRAKIFDKLLDSDFSIEDRGATVISVDATDEFTIFSQAEPRATILWLAELDANKVNVWIDDGTNFIPIIITSRKTKILDTESAILQKEIKFRYANPRESQRN